MESAVLRRFRHADRRRRHLVLLRHADYPPLPPAAFFDDFAQGAKATEAKIIAEIAKNLANHTIAEIERLLMTERHRRQWCRTVWFRA